MSPNELVKCKTYSSWEFINLSNQLVALQKRVENGKASDYHGICAALTLTKKQAEILRNMFREWDEFSGSFICPVPMEGTKPFDAYEAALGKGYVWNPHHPYGAARRRLLEHCISYVKECIVIQKAMHKKERLVRV